MAPPVGFGLVDRCLRAFYSLPNSLQAGATELPAGSSFVEAMLSFVHTTCPSLEILVIYDWKT